MYRAFRLVSITACTLVGLALLASGLVPSFRQWMTPLEWYVFATLAGILGGTALALMILADKGMRRGAVFGLICAGYTAFISLALFFSGEFANWLGRGLSGAFILAMVWILFQGTKKLRPS